MDELLQKMLESQILSEDTKKELEDAMAKKINEAVETAKTEAAADVRAELTEQWIAERETLIEAIDVKVEDFLKNEMEELKEDIERFRDLEAEYAEKLVEAKAQMADELKGDMSELVEKIDSFLEIRLADELEELREDIEVVRKNDFGRRVFESVVEEYRKNFINEDSVEAELRETQSRYDDTVEALQETEKELSDLRRKLKLDEVLKPLSGRSKDVMEAVLKNVPTEQLDEAYKTFFSRVMKETAEGKTSEKETPVLAEGDKGNAKKSVVVSGDNEELITERKKEDTGHLSESNSEWLKRMAGI